MTTSSLQRGNFSAPRDTADAFQLREGMTFHDWVAVGRRLACVSSASAWALGDWLLLGQHSFAGRYRRAIDDTNLDYQTLRNYACVARRFDAGRRRQHLSFQHHAVVAPLSDAEQDLWLGRAESGGWSRNELRQRLSLHRAATITTPSAAAVAIVLRVELTREDEERWRRAAASTHLALPDWLRGVVDAAADAALNGGDGAVRGSAAQVTRPVGESITPVALSR